MIDAGLFAVLVTTLYFGWKFTSRSAYESAAYAVLESEESFEIRKYPDLMLATTKMQSESQGDDGSFTRLFRYIDGENNEQQKVSMTTPVFMEPSDQETPGQMGFVIPQEVEKQGIPKPASGNVNIQKRMGGQFGVIRFSGRLNRESAAEAERKLRKWLVENDRTPEGDAERAGYDPPWTPGPFRRNEILIRLK